MFEKTYRIFKCVVAVYCFDNDICYLQKVRGSKAYNKGLSFLLHLNTYEYWPECGFSISDFFNSRRVRFDQQSSLWTYRDIFVLFSIPFYLHLYLFLFTARFVSECLAEFKLFGSVSRVFNHGLPWRRFISSYVLWCSYDPWSL